ncbi:hypothetical protein C2845_PM16G03220 [Panicum miliaceum]|uniref:Retrotransposon gag domain-containing protein n=1 Tax=Panicum miliaceum TaxID=4540 RepID=A0A3L6PUP3_PANMI|nr:hypothetical protein C2845_PM16G03220 [Panicum miliaceum]
MRPSCPVGHRRGRQRPRAVCAGRAEHHHRNAAPTHPARACRASTAGAPHQHPDVGGAYHRIAGGKLRVTPSARGLLPSRRGRLAASKPLSPSGHEVAATPHPNLVPASQRLTMHGKLGCNYDARNVNHSQQLARHNTDVDRAAKDAANSHQPEGYPDGPGPQAFGRRIQKAPFPLRFRPPTNIKKYTRETNPAYLLLEFLPPNSIRSWAELKQVFIGNFHETYVRPGNSWDLKSCKQKPGKSLRDYIRRFSKQCNSLPNVVDADVKLGYRKSRTTRELLDITMNHASDEEAVGAVFIDGPTMGKARREDRDEGPSSRQKKTNKKDRRRPNPNIVVAGD